MEDFGDKLFADILEEGEKIYEAQREAVENKKDSERIETSGKDKQLLFISLPLKVVSYIIRNHIVINDKTGKKEENPMFKFGTLAMLPADLGLSKEHQVLSLPWTVKHIVSGWNSGHVASQPIHVNRLAAYDNQVEFVPVKKGESTLAVVSKCRYGSVPYIPNTEYVPWVNNMFRLTNEAIVARDIPPMLVTAFKNKKMVWPGASAPGIIKRTQDAVPFKIPKPVSLAWLLGPDNCERVRLLAIKIDPQVAYDLPDLPNGIFAGQASLWSTFFAGFAYDRFGTVSVSRMLIGAGYRGFYGQLSDIPIWADKPCVFKIPNRRESIIAHTYINYRDLTKWPDAYLAYIMTPEEMNFCVRTSKVVALAMPITAVLSQAPQVEIFAKRFSHVSVKVFMSDPPCVVFEKADKGLLGLGLKDHLKLLEKAFIKGFLEVFVQRCKGTYYYGFEVLPADTYTAVACHVRLELLTHAPAFVSHAYMSMTDAERKKTVPTDRVSDVKVDGKLIFADIDAGVIPSYPRCSPKNFINNMDFFDLGDTYQYAAPHNYVETTKINPYHWTNGSAVETVLGADNETFINLGGGAAPAPPPPGGIPAADPDLDGEPVEEGEMEEDPLADIGAEDMDAPGSPRYVPVPEEDRMA